MTRISKNLGHWKTCGRIRIQTGTKMEVFTHDISLSKLLGGIFFQNSTQTVDNETLDGVLGGFGHLDTDDIAESKIFLKNLKLSAYDRAVGKRDHFHSN